MLGSLWIGWQTFIEATQRSNRRMPVNFSSVWWTLSNWRSHKVHPDPILLHIILNFKWLRFINVLSNRSTRELFFEWMKYFLFVCSRCSLSYQRSLTYSSICLNLTSDTLDDCFSDYFRPEQLPISCTRCPSNHMEIATKFQTLPR